MKTLKVIIYFVIVLGLALLLGIGIYHLVDYYKERNTAVISVEEDIVEGCVNLNLVDTVYCLRNNINKIYIYNISNVNRGLTFEQLKAEGGVCTHYSQLYKDAAESLGFVADYVIVDMRGEGANHVFTIISDENSYCVLEQILKPHCVKIE